MAPPSSMHPSRRCMDMERASREVWAKRVERWQDSGLTAKEFAAELDVSPNSLTFWKWKLRRLANGEAPPVRMPAKRRTPKPKGASAQFLQLVATNVPEHHPPVTSRLCS